MQVSPEKVKLFRKENSWSQELLAKASGLSLRTIQRVEKDGKASVETQLALAGAFNKSPKELFIISPQIDVTWKGKNMLNAIIALAVVIGAVSMLIELAGELSLFVDAASIIFILLFMYACTAIAFGGEGLVKSIAGLRYIFSQKVEPSPASELLAYIYKKQLFFLYGGAVIGLIIGSISIHSNVEENLIFHRAYAVNLLVLFYAAVISEGVLRPLATKLEARINALT